MELLLQSFDDGIGTLTLANDAKRNALSEELLDQLVFALAEMKGRSARAVILTARKGATIWSAGHDIGELAKPGHDPLAYDDPLEKAIRAIQAFPAPVIAMVEGSVWGGACELVLTCDIRVGTPQTTFAITPAKLGVPYNLNGLMNLIGAVGLSTAKRMLFTAAPLPAAKAEQLGLLAEVVPADELEAYTLGLARQIAKNSALAISVIKEQVRILGRAHALAPDTFEHIQSLRRLVYESADYREAIETFLKKRKPSAPAS
jgi:methylmalonyl-CoA decarboxylase